MTKDNDTVEENINLLDKDGLSDLMALMADRGYQDSLQLGTNLMMLGLVQMRGFGVPEDEISSIVEDQVPLADMILEIITLAGLSDAT